MRLAILPLLCLLAACAAAPAADGVNDPWEPANRQVHAFNVGLDRAVIGPVTRPLKAAAGGAAGAGGSDGASDGASPNGGGGEGPLTLVARVGDNLSLPGKVLNHLLQGRPEKAGRNAARFVINTTLGLGGLHDPAGSEFRLPEIDTDFGETLHVWGLPEGPYVVLPVLGPSTARDAVGKVVDRVIDPLDGVLNEDQRRGATAIKLVSKAGDRARFGDTVDGVLHGSADSYVQMRLLYLQHRRFELGQEAEIIDPYAE